MHLKRTTKMICTAILLSLLSVCFASCKHQPPLRSIDAAYDLHSIKTLHDIAETYVSEEIGSDYALWGFNVTRNNADNTETAEFVYTKRTQSFRDVYFVKIDIANRQINSTVQTEAERLYGGDTVVSVSDWVLDDLDLLFDTSFEWDSATAETTYQNLDIRYYLNNELRYECEFDPCSGQLLGENGDK